MSTKSVLQKVLAWSYSKFWQNLIDMVLDLICIQVCFKRYLKIRKFMSETIWHIFNKNYSKLTQELENSSQKRFDNILDIKWTIFSFKTAKKLQDSSCCQFYMILDINWTVLFFAKTTKKSENSSQWRFDFILNKN